MTGAPAPALHYRIIGSGPVALACALFMVRGGIDPARLILRLPQAATARPASADGLRDSAGTSARGPAESSAGASVGTPARRILALSDGSHQLLSRITTLPEGGLIERIEVALSGRNGRTRIEARDFGVAALGHVIPYPELVAALRAAAQRLPLAHACEPAPGAAESPNPVLTIHADGIAPVTAASRTGFRKREFHQSALLTEVMAETGGTTAYECFGSHGPLALLPAGPGHSPRYALVWCDEPDATAERAAMEPSRLSAAVTQAIAAFGIPDAALGALRVCAAVEVAPLSRLRRVDSAAGLEVWIGNAAQALHPVAGQGLNLGLRDAFELARSLADNEYAEQPLAAETVLARFAGRRRLDRTITIGVTDLLASTFGWPLARPLQSALLTAMDLLPPLRRPLASTLLFGRR